MSVLDGYNKYKRYIKTNDGYKLCSQWTSSNTVQMDDGNTLQTNLGAINGITDSLTATSSNIAASAAAVKTLNDNLDTQIRTHPRGSYKSILSIVKDMPSDKNRIYNITSDFTDYPPIMVNMGYIVYPVIEVVSKGSVRYITLTACDANGYSKKIIGYTTLDLSSILWKFDTNIIDVLHLQATNSTSNPSVFTVNLPEKYQNISTVTLYVVAQPGYGWGSLAVTNAGISNKVIYIATNYSGSVISPFFNIILSY